MDRRQSPAKKTSGGMELYEPSVRPEVNFKYIEELMDGNFDLAWTTVEWLALIGVMFGIVLAIVFGFAKLGFQYAPWIVAVALLVWFFQ